MSPRGVDTQPTGEGQAGFMLVEVLVAVMVAGLFLSVLGRALAGAWGATRTPAEVLTAVDLARAELLTAPGAEPVRDGPPRGFSVSRRIGFVEIVSRPADLAPAPPVAAPAEEPGQPVRNDAMPGVTHHPPSGVGASGQLQRVSVLVRTPSGRNLTFETIRLDVPPE